MRTIHVDDVVVPENRQREHFDERAMEELISSICKPIGLLQPIILRNDCRTLVAGERRLRAVRDISESELPIRHNNSAISIGEIPYVILDDLPEELVREAELEENIRRIDLTWQEKCIAVKELYDFRVAADPATTLESITLDFAGDTLDETTSTNVSNVGGGTSVSGGGY